MQPTTASNKERDQIQYVLYVNEAVKPLWRCICCARARRSVCPTSVPATRAALSPAHIGTSPRCNLKQILTSDQVLRAAQPKELPSRRARLGCGASSLLCRHTGAHAFVEALWSTGTAVKSLDSNKVSCTLYRLRLGTEFGPRTTRERVGTSAEDPVPTVGRYTWTLPAQVEALAYLKLQKRTYFSVPLDVCKGLETVTE